MSYEHNTVVIDEADLQPIIERLLSKPDVTTLHVRTLAPQCFPYAVAADWRQFEPTMAGEASESAAVPEGALSARLLLSARPGRTSGRYYTCAVGKGGLR
jgi:hypothetical protein